MTRIENKDDLEKEADELLAPYLKAKKKNKSAKEEYPILSDSQLKRRRSKEIPFSNLSLKQKEKTEAGPEDQDE